MLTRHFILLSSNVIRCYEHWDTTQIREIHMTPTRSNKFSVTFLALTFQLLVIPQILSHLAHPTTATNLNATNPANMTKDDILVMMASHINVSSVYDSFNQFKLFHQVDNDIRIIFQQSKGESIFHMCMCWWPWKEISLNKLRVKHD